MRLILVHSWGPMGSSLVNAILEKFGVLNLPIRDVGLSASVIKPSESPIDSSLVKKGIIDYLETLCRPVSLGGVGMLDRDNQNEIIRADKKKVEKEIDQFKNHEFCSISDVFFSGRNLVAKALTYKENPPSIVAHGELINDSINYWKDPKQLWDGYRYHFPDVKVIHMHREFKGWLNSLASQKMVKASWKNRSRFDFTHRVRGYKRFEKMAASIDGLNIDFSNLFADPFHSLVENIGRYIELPVPELNWEAEIYDLFGKLVSFQTAFVPFDDKREFLSRTALDKMEKWAFGCDYLPVVLWREAMARVIYMQSCHRFWSNRNKIVDK